MIIDDEKSKATMQTLNEKSRELKSDDLNRLQQTFKNSQFNSF